VPGGTHHIDSVFYVTALVLGDRDEARGGRGRRIEKAHGRDALLAVSLALVCLVLSGCANPKPGTTTSGEEPRPPSAEAVIRGMVTEVRRMPQANSGGGGVGERVGVVLVEENPGEESGSQKDSVTVTKATKLFERQGRDLTRIRSDAYRWGNGQGRGTRGRSRNRTRGRQRPA
jgi:hypothetical protein